MAYLNFLFVVGSKFVDHNHKWLLGNTAQYNSDCLLKFYNTLTMDVSLQPII